MEQIIEEWCRLIGVFDQQAIHVAVGVAAGGLLLMPVVLIILVIFGVLSVATK